jgi:hypothetical protein
LFKLFQQQAEAIGILTLRNTIGDEAVYDMRENFPNSYLADIIERHPHQMGGVTKGKLQAEYDVED